MEKMAGVSEQLGMQVSINHRKGETGDVVVRYKAMELEKGLLTVVNATPGRTAGTFSVPRMVVRFP